jgi:hypothetical protein
MAGAGRARISLFEAFDLGHSAIVATPEKFNEAAVAQHLKLLAYLLSNMLVHGIETTQARLKCIDLGKIELSFADVLDALHNVEQPASRSALLVA